jgi:L-fuculose-phosphate aldolase
MNSVLRKQLIETALEMRKCGLVQGATGNLSVRHEGGMLITPTGIDYSVLLPDDIVEMGFDGSTEGKRKPSSEWRFHAAIYQQRPEANAILHAHPTNCTALACQGLGIPAFHYMVAVAGGKDIRCAKYATFGSQQLSDHMIEALEDRKACLMAHHGLTCFESDLVRALSLDTEIEHLAGVYCRILSMGRAEILDDVEMARVVEKFKTYGRQDG